MEPVDERSRAGHVVRPGFGPSYVDSHPTSSTTQAPITRWAPIQNASEFQELIENPMKSDPGEEVCLEIVSLVRLKDTVRRHLPSTSMTRRIILSEEDYFPIHEAIAKFKAFDRLLCEELAL